MLIISKNMSQHQSRTWSLQLMLPPIALCIVSMSSIHITGSTSSNSVEDEIAGWIESVERKLSNNCYLPSNMHHQPTTVSMTWNGAHTVVRNKNEMFNLLLFNETTELLPCLIARTIPTNIDLMIGLPTIRKHDLGCLAELAQLDVPLH